MQHIVGHDLLTVILMRLGEHDCQHNDYDDYAPSQPLTRSEETTIPFLFVCIQQDRPQEEIVKPRPLLSRPRLALRRLASHVLLHPSFAAAFEGGLRLTLNIPNEPKKDIVSLKYPKRGRNLPVRSIFGRHDTCFFCLSPDQLSFERDHGSQLLLPNNIP